MNNTTRNLTAGIALLLIGLSLVMAVNLTAPRAVRADPGMLYAAPTAQGSGNCTTWANACALQTALAQATAGDEIWVKAGVHYPGVAGNRIATFTIKDGVALYGGFAGTEVSRDQRDWQANPTILSGDIDQNDINTDGNFIAETVEDIQGENAYHVLTAVHATSISFTLDGFVITAGLGEEFGDEGEGGGLRAGHSNATLRNIIFCGNDVWGSGGGLYAYSSTIRLTTVTFSGNEAGYGGGIYLSSSTAELINATFIDNTSFGDGGGMMITYGSTATLATITFENNLAMGYSGSGLSVGDIAGGSSSVVLTDVTFIDNGYSSLTKYGGGMFACYNCTADLTNVAFTRNSAEDGGGLYSDGRSTLTNVTFNNNTATDAGGGMFNWNSGTVLTNVAFANNNAARGGGFFNANSNPTLTGIVFSNNTANYGGGLYAHGKPVLSNALFNKNTANSAGGGVYLINQSTTLVNVTISGNISNEGGGIFINNCYPNLTNSILWGNTAPVGAEMTILSGYPIITYSIVRGGWGGNLDADPLFVDPTNGNLRLKPSSPAIDAGNNAAVPAGIITDLDGNSRFVDIPSIPNTGKGTPPIVDMGAYEVQEQEQRYIFLPLVIRNAP